MKKLGLKKSAPGFVYIISNSKDKKVIKIGRTHLPPEERALTFTKHPATTGEFVVEWSLEVEQMYLAEKILQFKFIDFWEDGENFRFPVKQAITIAKLVMQSFQTTVSKEGKLVAIQQTNHAKSRGILKSTIREWESIKATKTRKFLKRVIDLCLKEGRAGSTKGQHFVSIRTNKSTKIGNVDFYIQKQHIRVYINCSTEIKDKAKQIVKSQFKYYEQQSPAIKDFKHGFQFLIESDAQFEVIVKWLKLGNK